VDHYAQFALLDVGETVHGQLVQKFIAADRLVAPAVEVQQEKHTFFQSLLPLFVHRIFLFLSGARPEALRQPIWLLPKEESPPPAPSVASGDTRAAAERDFSRE
jgi:hypothetical protein